MPGITTLITTLTTINPITWPAGTRSRFSTTASPPIRPNTAPDAPATEPSGAENSITAADPPSSEIRYTARNRPRPSTSSMSRPSTHSATC